jgi:periplasmic protein TonB
MVKLIGGIFLLLFSSQMSFAQKDQLADSVVDKEEVFSVVEQPAEFPGGITKFQKFLSKNMKYPKEAKRLGIEGKVFVEFVIDTTGYLLMNSVNVKRGVHKLIDDEALRVIKTLPRWKPGFSTRLNRFVRQRWVIPIMFKL